jgi:putative ABC transport system ATP-binding protein
MEENIIQTENLTKIYKLPGEEVRALNGVNFSIKQGDFVSIMGPSGSGKTTLMNMLGCLDSPTSGELTILGHSVSRLKEKDVSDIRRKNIGFVFQDFYLIPSLSTLENVEMAMYFSRKGVDRSQAINILEKVGLGHRLKHLPNKLSGGEMQRIAIARALAISPKILLADEPTGNLDSKNTQNIFDLLKQLNDEGLTILMVTHNIKLGSQCKRTISMADGNIEEDRHLASA